jgi:hypothetical protein
MAREQAVIEELPHVPHFEERDFPRPDVQSWNRIIEAQLVEILDPLLGQDIVVDIGAMVGAVGLTMNPRANAGLTWFFHTDERS